MTTVWRRYFAAPTSGDGTPPFYGDLSEWNDTEDLVRLYARTTPYVNATNPHDLASGDEAVIGRRIALTRSYVLPDVLTDRVLSGRLRFVSLVNNSFSTSNPTYVRAVVKVLTPTGDTRGLLASLQSSNAVVSSTYATRRVDGALTPVTAQAGDRIVVELGADTGLSSGTNSGFIMRLGGETPGPNAVDLPFVDGHTLPGLPWFELELDDPPPAITGLTATPTSSTSVFLSWDETAPTDTYRVSVDGAPSVDVGDATTWAVEGLAPSTLYQFVVTAHNAVGSSPPATVYATTLEPPGGPGWYRAQVIVGDHSWTAERGDGATLGPILPLTLGWETPDDQPVPGQPGPDTATVELVTATALADVATGTPARVTVWLDSSPGARPYATVAGEVGDLEVFPQGLPDGTPAVRTRLLLVGHETAANAYEVGAQAWPAESGDARAARIMAEAGSLLWWPSTPVGNTFAARPAQLTPKGDALGQTLAEAAVYTAGDYSPPARHLWRAVADADGRLDGYTAELVAAETTAIDLLDGAWVNRAASWRRTRRRDGAWIQVTTPTGVRIYGRVAGPPMPPATLQVMDADAWADLHLSSLFTQAWVSGEWFRVHLHAGAPLSYGLEWFRRDLDSPGFPWATRAVAVENIQVMPGLFTRYAGMLAGARLTIEPGGRVMLLFRLRPDVPAWSTVTPRWMDEPPEALWSDEPPTATWADLRTTPREDA